MKNRSEFANAAQLFLLLCLLFWSLTWNSSSKIEYTRYSTIKHDKRLISKDINCEKSEKLRLTYQHYYFIKSLATIQYVPEEAPGFAMETNSILPTFNEWKEMEKHKHDAGMQNKEVTNNKRAASRRKLNFSSSKCGAKILASNPEAKHRTAILNEKADEYLLNPCRVRTWFVIELCDTVEATQIELANYELYSSSPWKFDVFWSDIYPTVLWHLLGTYEAKDRRTMQTFEVNVKNLGKFIRVVIYSHHGKEHYCPLSVIRILGYSMVQDFEDKENANNDNEPNFIFSPRDNDKKEITNGISFEVPPDYKQIHSMDIIPSRICSLFIYCNDISLKNKDLSGKICVYRPVCQFLNAFFVNFNKLCKNNICDAHFYNDKIAGMQKNMSLIANNNGKTHFKDGLNEKFPNLSLPKEIKSVQENNSSLRSSKEDIFTPSLISRSYHLQSSKEYSQKYDSMKNFTNNTIKNNAKNHGNGTKENITEENPNKECICNPKEVKTSYQSSQVYSGKELELDIGIPEAKDSVDSAGLIQKESVLIRLTSRIKSSENELNLINRYLQQLSQSYRVQMESMQVLFNHTVKAINIASEKSAIFNNNQEESINALKIKVNSLNLKIDHLVNGNKDLIIRVVELHGFFLIIEIIIISTIFTIFLNVFRRRNIVFRTGNRHFWKMVA